MIKSEKLIIKLLRYDYIFVFVAVFACLFAWISHSRDFTINANKRFIAAAAIGTPLSELDKIYTRRLFPDKKPVHDIGTPPPRLVTGDSDTSRTAVSYVTYSEHKRSGRYYVLLDANDIIVGVMWR